MYSDFANDGEVKIVKDAANIVIALLENAFNFIGLINFVHFLFVLFFLSDSKTSRSRNIIMQKKSPLIKKEIYIYRGMDRHNQTPCLPLSSIL
jgi:hypothetical protein